MIFVFVFLFVFNGDIKLEKKVYSTQEICVQAGQAYINKMEQDPRYEGGLASACVPLKGQKS